MHRIASNSSWSSRAISIVGRRSRSAEDLLQFVRGDHLELIVAAIFGLFVGPPPQKRCGVPEAIALQVVVLDLADPLDAERLPRQILSRAPPALAARHPRHIATGRFRPSLPPSLSEP